MKKLLSSMVVAGLLVTTSFASDIKTDNVKHNAVLKAERKLNNHQSVNEAIRALKYTQDAYIYLNGKNIKQAKISINKAINQLNIVLENPNAPYLLPLKVDMSEFEYVGNIKNISTQIKLAKQALLKNDLPLTRNILDNLKSEIDIRSINIPLGTYPKILKLSLKYINENKIEQAKELIAMSINTLVSVNTTIPIPLLKANGLVKEASKISHKDKKQALKYIEEAQKQLKIANLLGYSSTSHTTYEDLEKSLNLIKDKLSNNKKTDSLFEDLKNKLEEFKEKATKVISK